MEKEKAIRGYHVLKQLSYIEITFGVYTEYGGCLGEMSMEWKELNCKLIPRLICFEDSWDVLSEFKDLIDELAKVSKRNITDSEFCKILSSLNFKDLTDYQNYPEMVTVTMEKRKAKNLD